MATLIGAFLLSPAPTNYSGNYTLLDWYIQQNTRLHMNQCSRCRSGSRFSVAAFLHRCQPRTDPHLPEAQPSAHASYVRERPSLSQLQQPLHQQRTKQTWGGPSRKKPSKLRHFASPPVLSERPLLPLRSTSALHGLCMVRQAQQLCTVRQAQVL